MRAEAACAAVGGSAGSSSAPRRRRAFGAAFPAPRESPRCLTNHAHAYCVQGREPLFVPCTPLGCIELLDRLAIPIRGKRAVVIGRSNIVGMPVALLLLKRDATVSICHSATQGMQELVAQADIVVAAAGQAEMIKVRDARAFGRAAAAVDAHKPGA